MRWGSQLPHLFSLVIPEGHDTAPDAWAAELELAARQVLPGPMAAAKATDWGS